jgi:hypothetical protein
MLLPRLAAGDALEKLEFVACLPITNRTSSKPA